MKKKVLSVIAILALVAVLAVVLVACNPSSYQKKLEDANYKVTVSEEDSDAVKLVNKGLELDGGYEGKVTWIVSGTKFGVSLSSGVEAGSVTITKFEKSADAKKYVEDFLGGESDTVVRKGTVVITGDADSVELVK